MNLGTMQMNRGQILAMAELVSVSGVMLHAEPAAGQGKGSL
jgi:hypothetical protein